MDIRRGTEIGRNGHFNQTQQKELDIMEETSKGVGQFVINTESDPTIR
jgi:hypothetical protein